MCIGKDNLTPAPAMIARGSVLIDSQDSYIQLMADMEASAMAFAGSALDDIDESGREELHYFMTHGIDMSATKSRRPYQSHAMRYAWIISGVGPGTWEHGSADQPLAVRDAKEIGKRFLGVSEDGALVMLTGAKGARPRWLGGVIGIGTWGNALYPAGSSQPVQQAIVDRNKAKTETARQSILDDWTQMLERRYIAITR